MTLLGFDCVDSTNRILIDMARDGAPAGTTVWARRQTGGRGRLGRSFASPSGGIYISFLLPLPENPLEVGFSLTAMSGIAVKRTINEICHRDCGIKWVNDIILDGKKVCGILAQVAADKVVVGIGINYCTPASEFSPEVREIATSIYQDQKVAPPMETFVEALVRNIYTICFGMDENWLVEYKGSSTIVGNKVQIIQAGKVTGTGTAVSIDDACFLHVIGDDGKETVLSTGEVSIRKSYD